MSSSQKEGRWKIDKDSFKKKTKKKSRKQHLMVWKNKEQMDLIFKRITRQSLKKKSLT